MSTEEDSKDLDEMRKKLQEADFSVSCMKCSSQIMTAEDSEE